MRGWVRFFMIILVFLSCTLPCWLRDLHAAYSPLKIESVYLENIIPSRHSYYTQEPFGRVSVRNTTRWTLKRIGISIFIPGYMDLPQVLEIPEIRPKSTIWVPLTAAFNRRIFEVYEDTPVQAEVKGRMGDVEEVYVQSVTILSRNTIDWRVSGNVASFVTPSDPAIISFTRMVIPSIHDRTLDGLVGKLQNAMSIWTALGSIRYLSDPIMPYKKVVEKKVPLDRIQFPRETLRYKRGDCDDLSVLFASCLEAVGIRTAFVLVPGHIFLMFNTGVPEKDGELISYDQGLYIVKDGSIWLPVETTRLGDSFIGAVKEGINEYRRHLGRIEIVDVREAWDRFPPVPLPRADFVWEEEERVLAEGRLREEIVRFKRYREEQFNLVVVSLRNRVKKSPDNPLLHNRLGIILGREGRYDLAEREFEDILKGNKTHPSALNNLGNIHLLRTSVDEAISFYREAVRSDPQDPAILFNLGLAFFIKGEMEAALEMLGKSLSGFSNLDEAARTLGFSFEGMALSLTGSTKMSKEEVKRLLDEALSKIPEDMEGIKKKAKILFGVFAGTRGADISEEADLRWLLYWKG